MEPIYTNDQIDAEAYRRLMTVMHLGLEEAYTLKQKDIVIDALNSISIEIEKSKKWLQDRE